jgi:hypothetical protein
MLIKELYEWKLSKNNELLNYDSLYELTKHREVLDIGYKDLLQTMEWQIKRLEILGRDGYKCQKCNEISDKNHVHHKWYIKDEFPWEIESNALVTLCHFCHKEAHLSEIPVFGKNTDGSLYHTMNQNIYCARCNGAGWLPQFRHVQDGICFLCWGDCISKTIFSDAINAFNKRKTPTYEDNLLLQLEMLLARFDIEFYRDNIKPMRNTIDFPF